MLARAGRASLTATGKASADPAAAKTYAMHAHGAVFAEVKVDPDLGQIRVTRLVGAFAAGRIVNQSSILGSLATIGAGQGGSWATPGYTSSKAALNMLTVVLAQHLADTNIKVNAAHPGWVKTDLGGEGAPLGVREGARTAVRLALLPADGPTGGYFHEEESLPW